MALKKKSFSSRGVYILIFVLMTAVLLFAGYASWKQFQRHKKITAEVSLLETEKERVEKENESLQERIKYFATESFQEQESKERLNMRKDNEFVVDIERVERQSEENAATSPRSGSLKNIEPNYKKWWKKIF